MFKKIVFLFILSAFSHLATASEKSLMTFFKEVGTFQANFEQTVVDESGRSLDFKDGVFTFSRPGKFRWNYNSQDEFEPLGQQIISDGALITFYEPDLDTASQRSMTDAISQVPTLLLVQNSSNLDAHFNVSDYDKTDGLTWVGLKPKDEDSSYQSLMVGFKSDQLSAIIMTDALGNETRLRLSDVRTNIDLERGVFKFKPSPSTDVVRR